jgi:glycerol-3-phosphate dehydrogenase
MAKRAKNKWSRRKKIAVIGGGIAGALILRAGAGYAVTQHYMGHSGVRRSSINRRIRSIRHF